MNVKCRIDARSQCKPIIVNGHVVVCGADTVEAYIPQRFLGSPAHGTSPAAARGWQCGPDSAQ